MLGHGIPSYLTIYDAHLTSIFNVFSYDAVVSRDSNLLPPRRRAVALLVNATVAEVNELILLLSSCNHSHKRSNVTTNI